MNYKRHHLKKKKDESWVVVAHSFSPSTQEAETGTSLISRPAWTTDWIARAMQRNSLEKNGAKDITRKETSLEEEGVSKSGVVEERAVGQTI